MQAETNPYETPVATEAEVATAELRRPLMGTILIGVWLLEGGFKACLLSLALASGSNPLENLAQQYSSWNRLFFFLASSFMITETIGPWFGVYYLTGRRAKTIPFETAIVRTLLVSGGVAIGITLLLMAYCELAKFVRSAGP